MWKGFLEEVGYGTTLKQIQIWVPSQQILEHWAASEWDGRAPDFRNGPWTRFSRQHTTWSKHGHPNTQQHEWSNPLTPSSDYHHAASIATMPHELFYIFGEKPSALGVHAYLPMKRVQIFRRLETSPLMDDAGISWWDSLILRPYDPQCAQWYNGCNQDVGVDFSM